MWQPHGPQILFGTVHLKIKKKKITAMQTWSHGYFSVSHGRGYHLGRKDPFFPHGPFCMSNFPGQRSSPNTGQMEALA